MYSLLQTGRLAADHPSLSIGNAVGAAQILVSLVFEFNLSAAITEGVWLVLSLYGLARALRCA